MVRAGAMVEGEGLWYKAMVRRRAMVEGYGMNRGLR